MNISTQNVMNLDHLFLCWLGLTPLGRKCNEEEEEEEENLDNTHFADFSKTKCQQPWMKQSGCSKLTEYLLLSTRLDRLAQRLPHICFHTHCYTFIARMIYVDMQ